jgi:guanine deaminase
MMAQSDRDQYMRRVIELAAQTCLVDKAGGPFAAVIVKDGKIVGEGVNRVVAENDPTWHGEVAAVRDACRKLGTVDLGGADMYTAGECCAMCYAASFWARIGHIYYAATIEDARVYGDFDDDAIDKALKQPYADRKVPLEQMLHDEMVVVWKKFNVLPGRARY